MHQFFLDFQLRMIMMSHQITHWMTYMWLWAYWDAMSHEVKSMGANHAENVVPNNGTFPNSQIIGSCTNLCALLSDLASTRFKSVLCQCNHLLEKVSKLQAHWCLRPPVVQLVEGLESSITCTETQDLNMYEDPVSWKSICHTLQGCHAMLGHYPSYNGDASIVQ